MYVLFIYTPSFSTQLIWLQFNFDTGIV